MNKLELLTLLHAHELPQCWDQPTPDDLASILGTFPLFSGVSRRRLRGLVSNATLAEFAPGETIISPGDQGDVLYIILAGHAKATSSRISQVFRTGDYFGEVAMIDGHAGSLNIAAMSYVQVMKFPSRAVLNLARRHPAITITMLENLTARLRGRETQAARAA